jgi:arylsulfatase A-like enzyme
MIWKNGWLTYGHQASGGFRGFKQDPSEDGIRVPFIVRWPGKAEPGSVTPALICAGDILATYADILGETLRQDEGEDSYSFLANILDKNAPQGRETVVPASGSSGALIVIRDGWKYIEAAKPGRWPETWYPDGPGDSIPRLFNLKVDSQEKNNLCEEFPAKAAEMAEIMHRVSDNTKSERIK